MNQEASPAWHFIPRIVSSLICLALVLLTSIAHAQQGGPTTVGVSTALSGSASAFGVDIKNALTLMNDLTGQGRYKLIFEDERCDNRTAVSVAHKLINIDKVKYVLGFPCNSTLLATASIYSRANVLVLTSSATSGDVLDIGKGIFRLFPSDVAGAQLLLKYMAARHKRVGILTEQNEYPVMMERSVRKENERLSNPLAIVSEDFVHGETDFRSVLLRLTKGAIEGLFINANTDDSFIAVVKQIRASQFKGALYAVYLPASDTARKALGPALNGFVFANLPVTDELVTAPGRELLKEFRKRYGEPQSGFPVVPISFEAFRIFDLALRSGKSPMDFLGSTHFTGGFVPDFSFDQHGAVRGINFQMQKIENDAVVRLNE